MKKCAEIKLFFCIGEDIGKFGGAFKVTKGLQEEFGENRVIDTPISESGVVGMAIGAAMCGMRPVVEMQFADFVSGAFTHLVFNAATAHFRWEQAVPMVVRLPSGGGVGGGPFHSTNLEACFFHIPGLKLVAPSNPNDARGLLKASIRDNNPVLFYEHKYLYRRLKDALTEDDGTIELGRAAIAREGRDISIITYSSMVSRSLEASEQLAEEGINVEVIDLRTLKPWDRQTVLSSVKKTSRVLVVHEAVRTGGIAGEISAEIAEFCFEYLDAPITRLASQDTPVPFAKALEDFFMPSTEKITEAVRQIVNY